jgi:hypothetical protein
MQDILDWLLTPQYYSSPRWVQVLTVTILALSALRSFLSLRKPAKS